MTKMLAGSLGSVSLTFKFVVYSYWIQATLKSYNSVSSWWHALCQHVAVIILCVSPERGSVVMLHTVNAQHVATTECENLVHCLAFSNAPEGRAVNVLVGGLSSGAIRSVEQASCCVMLTIMSVILKDITQPKILNKSN